MSTRKELILGAVQRGLCNKGKNRSKPIVDEIMRLSLDVEEELTALYRECTDKQRRLEVLCELHRIRRERPQEV
ncbi:hypothetical protein LCGC14_1949610 [marine sediment metagenome]|uniref:Uncharacterized protein n=1 Tax=marine sediment metagenome TaxID=412755 RepID=A0A0F9IEU5_9ZZZZ